MPHYLHVFYVNLFIYTTLFYVTPFIYPIPLSCNLFHLPNPFLSEPVFTQSLFYLFKTHPFFYPAHILCWPYQICKLIFIPPPLLPLDFLHCYVIHMLYISTRFLLQTWLYISLLIRKFFFYLISVITVGGIIIISCSLRFCILTYEIFNVLLDPFFTQALFEISNLYNVGGGESFCVINTWLITTPVW